MSTKLRAKLKWTEQINWDLLECKKRAKELVGPDTPPCNENGRKKGYIEVMKQLWEDKGYEHLGIRSQNLRDQASRLEKMEHGSAGKSQGGGVLGCDRERDDLNERTIDMISQQDLEPRNQRNESQNFNFEKASLYHVMLIVLQRVKICIRLLLCNKSQEIVLTRWRNDRTGQ